MEIAIGVLLIFSTYQFVRCWVIKRDLKNLGDESRKNKKELEEWKRKAVALKKYDGIANLENAEEVVRKSIQDLRASYAEKKIIFDKLKDESAIYDESIELAQLGFYEPHFDFDASEKYKDKINQIKSKQKFLISQKTAIVCRTDWTVEGSKAKGRTMTNRGIRLTARAFNNECDSAISRVSWNNMDRMEKRIDKAFNAINKLNESSTIKISYEYLQLKIEELHLSHEYKEKKQQEREEQAEIRRQIREEAQLEKESKAALKEEEKYQNLLAKAKLAAEKATGAKLDKLKEQISKLDEELEVAHKKSERAKSMAQQTKTGHVYVISNHGSFGENVYKIGMTRRLDPLDRVKELGDASVPFIFDVHAMICSEDAPALENKLHKAFNGKRLNLVNNRKEFFNVSIDRIRKEVEVIHPEAEFIETAEARQYRESMAIRKQKASALHAADEFPESI